MARLLVAEVDFRKNILCRPVSIFTLEDMLKKN